MGSLLQLVSLYLCTSSLLMLCLPGALPSSVAPESGSGGSGEATTPNSTVPATSPVLNDTGSPTTPNGACSTTTASPDATATCNNQMDFTCSLDSNVKDRKGAALAMYSITTT